MSETKIDVNNVLTKEELNLIHNYWRAANYLTIGQIYLLDNVLLKEPLKPEHIKPRLLGHWGTSPGLSLLWIHMNRIIIKYNLQNTMYLCGPGHGGPAIVACTYLEGTYTQVYPDITQDTNGLKKLFRQFSTPGGIPSHVSPHTPGSIHEGGELGYVLTHAFGAAFDNPDAFIIAVVGDGEAETGPLAGSWTGINFLNPVNDGAVLPVLHCNGYKISGPTIFGRTSSEQLGELFRGYGYNPIFVEGDNPDLVHPQIAAALEKCLNIITDIQTKARNGNHTNEYRWPMIVLRTPKGWTGPREVDGKPVENTFRSHQVPLSEVQTNMKHLKQLEEWMKSYEPNKLFDSNGRLLIEFNKIIPKGETRMSDNPITNGGGKLAKPLKLPDILSFAVNITNPGADKVSSTERLGQFMRDIYKLNPTNFRLYSPDETNSNKLGAVFEVSNRCFGNDGAKVQSIDEKLSRDGRVMEILSEHCCEGWLEGYSLTGRYGVFASYEAFTMIVSSMVAQHIKWFEMCNEIPWRKPIPSVNILLTSTCWRNDHNGFSHQGPGFMDLLLSKQGAVTRIYVPPDANCLLSIANHIFQTKNYINVVIIDKQPQLQYLTMEQAIEHCTAGASIWRFACNEINNEPDIVLACAGDYATQETLGAAAILMEQLPELSFRVVNVVDVMCLYIKKYHPHALPDELFTQLFTNDVDVVFAWHGFPGVVHQLLHSRPNATRFHVKGYLETGTTTTPFDMLVLNKTSRFHIVIEAINRVQTKMENDMKINVHRDTIESFDRVRKWCELQLDRHHKYIREHFEDLPELKNWTWHNAIKGIKGKQLPSDSNKDQYPIEPPK